MIDILLLITKQGNLASESGCGKRVQDYRWIKTPPGSRTQFGVFVQWHNLCRLFNAKTIPLEEQ